MKQVSLKTLLQQIKSYFSIQTIVSNCPKQLIALISSAMPKFITFAQTNISMALPQTLFSIFMVKSEIHQLKTWLGLVKGRSVGSSPSGWFLPIVDLNKSFDLGFPLPFLLGVCFFLGLDVLSLSSCSFSSRSPSSSMVTKSSSKSFFGSLFGVTCFSSRILVAASLDSFQFFILFTLSKT